MNSAQLNNKLRGGYYTPKPIADFLAKWAIKSPESKILEPSCGDVIIVESCVETLLKLGAPMDLISNLVYGIAILWESEARKTIIRLRNLDIHERFGNILSGDFFEVSRSFFHNDQLFDVVIGNPPFIRYQNFPENQREIAFRLMHKAGLHPNRLTNTWVALPRIPRIWICCDAPA